MLSLQVEQLQEESTGDVSAANSLDFSRKLPLVTRATPKRAVLVGYTQSNLQNMQTIDIIVVNETA